MPEFILPDKADRCPHCNSILRDPPNCCEMMMVEYRHQWNEELLENEENAESGDYYESQI